VIVVCPNCCQAFADVQSCLAHRGRGDWFCLTGLSSVGFELNRRGRWLLPPPESLLARSAGQRGVGS
jgi:hypothetical protein